MAQRPSDGKWRALDGEAILKTYRLAAGYLYQAHLRAELSRSLGVEWETPQEGMAELRGVSRAVDRRVLDAAGAGRRAHSNEQGAAGSTRPSGRRSRRATERSTSTSQAPRGLARPRRRARPRARRNSRDRIAPHDRDASSRRRNCSTIAGRMLGPQGLTEEHTAFSDPELVMAWAEAHRAGRFGRPRPPARRPRFSRSDGVERVGEDPDPGTAAALLDRRADRDGAAPRSRSSTRGASVDAPTVAGGDRRDRPPTRQLGALSREQAAMVRAVAASTDRVVCVVGLAGAGKTTATRAVAEAFADGRHRRARRGAVRRRRREAPGRDRHPSTTLHRLLAETISRRLRASSSTRPAWRRPACSHRCSSASSRRTARRC